MKTKDFRSLPPGGQEDIRIKAVLAVEGGKTRREVGELLGVTRQSVGQWVKLYKQDGVAALRAKPRGRPRGGSLRPWQCAQIARSVVERHPDQLKLPFYLWTREAVSQMIERRFGIVLSPWTVGRYLKRWGFTPQKPVKRALERDPQAEVAHAAVPRHSRPRQA
jgi:transposase